MCHSTAVEFVVCFVLHCVGDLHPLPAEQLRTRAALDIVELFAFVRHLCCNGKKLGRLGKNGENTINFLFYRVCQTSLPQNSDTGVYSANSLQQLCRIVCLGNN